MKQTQFVDLLIKSNAEPILMRTIDRFQNKSWKIQWMDLSLTQLLNAKTRLYDPIQHNRPIYSTSFSAKTNTKT